MKKMLIFLVIIGTPTILGPGLLVNAGEDLMSAAGITKFNRGILAPTFTTEDVAGNLVKLEDFRGKVVLLNFWATW